TFLIAHGHHAGTSGEAPRRGGGRLRHGGHPYHRRPVQWAAPRSGENSCLHVGRRPTLTLPLPPREGRSAQGGFSLSYFRHRYASFEEFQREALVDGEMLGKEELELLDEL